MFLYKIQADDILELMVGITLNAKMMVKLCS